MRQSLQSNFSKIQLELVYHYTILVCSAHHGSCRPLAEYTEKTLSISVWVTCPVLAIKAFYCMLAGHQTALPMYVVWEDTFFLMILSPVRNSFSFLKAWVATAWTISVVWRSQWAWVLRPFREKWKLMNIKRWIMASIIYVYLS